ncbi:uncharacterized protein C6orf47 homolog isoform X2 [Stegostoma tigrinum]|uniref:uncharacterized protein C6orf47 homolog isoform X2 n=1 Tax=Stegostoma tigrinum TaxID=3053191 RepID=UPI00286FF9D2|nr:uncharacterized protein C6orf47 homolog isoform X2 [Stegostoma tigrinum]
MRTRAEPNGSQEPGRGTHIPARSKRGLLGWLLLLPPQLAALLLGCIRRLRNWLLPPPWPWRRKRKERERSVEPELKVKVEEEVVLKNKASRATSLGREEGGVRRAKEVVSPAASTEPEPLEIGFNLVRHLFDAAVVSLLLVASPLARAALDALGLRGLLRLWLHGLALFLAASYGLALAAWLLRAYLAQLCLLFGAVQLLVLGVSLRHRGHRLEDRRWVDNGLEDHPLEVHLLEDRRWEDNGVEDHPLEDHLLEDPRWEDHPLEDHRWEDNGLEVQRLDDRLVQYVEAVGATTTGNP